MSETRDPGLLAGDAPRDPEELEAAATGLSGRLPAQITLGPVQLTVPVLPVSLAYYTQEIGLDVLEQGGGRASLGAGEHVVLELVEEAGARPGRGYTGLYHFALRVPARHDLARWLAHAARDQVKLVGLSDHFVSEAIYLSDPDGHGIEIYCDRPRASWGGRVGTRLTTEPLDVQSLLGELEDPATERFDGIPDGTVMGHVHLKVARIADTVAFYRDVVGFDLMVQIENHAAFLSVDGYHHHIGANIWESAGAPAPPAGTAALRHATIVLPDDAHRDGLIARVEHNGGETRESEDGPIILDPSGNPLLLAVA